MNRIFGAFSRNDSLCSWRLSLALSAACFLLALLISQGELQRERESLADRLAPSVLRFHILAESDTREDQQIKLEVRSLILDYLKAQLPHPSDKNTTIACLTQNKQEIVALANSYLKNRGFDYHADLQITHDYFPTRSYGQLVFPCGYYDAARITLGRGRGHNWWCVLYPQFCFVDTACTAIPRESRETLRQELTENDYLALENRRPDLQIRFLLPRLLSPAADMSEAAPEEDRGSAPADSQSPTVANPRTPQS